MKKGFTLVEMLAVVVVLSIIMAISINSLSAVRHTQLEKVYNEKISNIEKSAILYGQEHPDVFNSPTKCSDFNEELLPGVSDYKTYNYCVVINGLFLAENKYLDTDIVDGEAFIKNDLTGFNMLKYNIILYRNNNMVNAYVSPDEPKTDLDFNSKIPVQALVPQGGAYSSCNNDEYKVLIGDVYKCGKKELAIPSILTVQNNNQVKTCQTTDTKLVYNHEDYCCPNSTVYIDGYCVSTESVVNPVCPNNYDISENFNLCIYYNPLEESKCINDYNKRIVSTRYLCVNNSDSTIMIAPICSDGKVLNDNQNYCELGDYTLSSCGSNYIKMFTNNIYQCVLKSNHNNKIDPTCPTGKELTFRNLYCKVKNS